MTVYKSGCGIEMERVHFFQPGPACKGIGEFGKKFSVLHVILISLVKFSALGPCVTCRAGNEPAKHLSPWAEDG